MDGRFKKLLFSISRNGEFSLSDRGRLATGGAAIGELLVFFDRNPALNRLFLGMFNDDSGGVGIGEEPREGLAFLVGTGMARGIGDDRSLGRSRPGLPSRAAWGAGAAEAAWES